MWGKKKDSQIQCPQCKSFKTEHFSVRNRLQNAGAGLIIGGCVMTVFIITAIIGLPMILIGICVLIASLFYKDKGEMRCKGCEFRFNENAIRQEQAA